jgi:hypothetical protein
MRNAELCIANLPNTRTNAQFGCLQTFNSFFHFIRSFLAHFGRNDVLFGLLRFARNDGQNKQ